MTVPALRDVELFIDTGEMVALLGDSSSGTSTLMNVLGCLASDMPVELTPAQHPRR